ncbi:zinc finger protein 26 [Trichonephila inaurata madagascariensis]|uniref:Zinc finger protein 26 n=1 Tax=Trichonephila inaurata madagascariensis TaxID=2747483 RepID=A0A8X6WZA6_9ARAC|nr:zinc finger protein 26 [Trichonephila inaurata madagascariensis]
MYVLLVNNHSSLEGGTSFIRSEEHETPGSKEPKHAAKKKFKPIVFGIRKAETQTPEEAMSIIYDETYDCSEPHCSYSTPSRRQFQKHMLIHSDERPYVCFVCSYSFKRSDNLRQHLLLHSGEKPYACDFCPMRFMHRTLIDSSGKFKGQKFIDNLELGNFNKIRFECLVCPYVTDQYLDIRKHIAGHSRFKCTYCDSTFSRKETLKTHMNRHTGEKPFVCDLCPQKFSHPYSRYLHRKSHSSC